MIENWNTLMKLCGKCWNEPLFLRRQKRQKKKVQTQKFSTPPPHKILHILVAMKVLQNTWLSCVMKEHTALARMKCVLDLHDKILHELLNHDLPMCGTSNSTNKSKIVDWVPMTMCFPSSNGSPRFTLYPRCDLKQLSIGKGPSNPHKVRTCFSLNTCILVFVLFSDLRLISLSQFSML
jgi:hypothetical protein